MKTRKTVGLPSWMVKGIKNGQESEVLSSTIVGVAAFYIVANVALFCFNPFQEYLLLEIIADICILAILCGLGLLFTARISLLISMRSEALERSKNTKTDSEKSECEKRMKVLCINIDNEAA
jgi:hypothetical protein